MPLETESERVGCSSDVGVYGNLLPGTRVKLCSEVVVGT